MSKPGEADPRDRPQKIYGGTLQNLHRTSNVEADSSNRLKLFSAHILFVVSNDLLGSGHVGR
jgi:hypothetical protein